MATYWSRLCPVETATLAQWLLSTAATWSTPASAAKPSRIFEPQLPLALLRPILDTVLPCFGRPVLAYDLMLSRMQPGQSHAMHHDLQPSDWITRVHVPIVTNPGAWLAFEGEAETVYSDAYFEGGEEYPGEDIQVPKKVHFAVGWAYSFNTLERHSFGNDGTADRVHVLLDVRAK